MNFSLVKSFLPHMTKEDMRVIQVPNWYLSYYRRFPEKLENCKYKHIKAINDYIKQEKAHIIGIDLGKYHYLTASNIDRSFVFVDKHNTLSHLFRKYERRIANKQYDNSEAYSKLKTGLKSHINQVVNEMLEQTSNRFQTVFALGDHGSSHLSFPSLVFDLTYFAIKQRKNENDEILIVDESFTSIECPICHNRNQYNRTNKNKFKCTKCGFRHQNNDIVAASNIAKKGKLLVF